MNVMTRAALAALLAMACSCAVACSSAPSDCGSAPAPDLTGGGVIGLRDRLAAGRLRAVNRAVTALTASDGVRVNAASGVGLVWIEGTGVADGTIEADVCGR